MASLPLTPELKAEIEKLIRDERGAGRSTSKRRIAQLLQEKGKNVSPSRVYNVQSQMPDYTAQPRTNARTKTPANISAVEKETLKRYKAGDSTSAKLISDELKKNGINISSRSVLDIQHKMADEGKITKTLLGAKEKAANLKSATDYLKSQGYSTDGLSRDKIIHKAADVRLYRENQDFNILKSRLTTYAKNKSSQDKVSKALELRERLNADRSLATNPEFIKQVEAVKNIGVRPKEENPIRKSEKRRRVIKQQTPMWALRPAYQVELASTGDDVSRGESQKNVNIKRIFPDKFESDHIDRLRDRGLHAPFNIQLLTKKQHNIKKGLENRGLMDRAKGLFEFNPKVGPASGLLAENIIPVQPDPLTRQSLLFFDPLLMKKRWDYD